MAVFPLQVIVCLYVVGMLCGSSELVCINTYMYSGTLVYPFKILGLTPNRTYTKEIIPNETGKVINSFL